MVAAGHNEGCAATVVGDVDVDPSLLQEKVQQLGVVIPGGTE